MVRVFDFKNLLRQETGTRESPIPLDPTEKKREGGKEKSTSYTFNTRGSEAIQYSMGAIQHGGILSGTHRLIVANGARGDLFAWSGVGQV